MGNKALPQTRAQKGGPRNNPDPKELGPPIPRNFWGNGIKRESKNSVKGKEFKNVNGNGRKQEGGSYISGKLFPRDLTFNQA